MAGLSKPLCINDVLPLHLLTEVLVRVPVRDAFRCRCICKLWLSFLRDDPHFVGRFMLQRMGGQPSNEGGNREKLIPVEWSEIQSLLVAFSCRSLAPSALSLNFIRDDGFPGLPKKAILWVVSSDNGLILCSIEDSDAEYIICNPLTRQWLALPLCPDGRQSFDFGIGFICDALYNVSDDIQSVSFDNHFEAKVVCLHATLTRNVDSLEMHAEIFSTRTGWSTSQLPEAIYSKLAVRSKVIPFNRKLYWLLRNLDLLIYDLSTNEFIVENNRPPPDEMQNFIGKETVVIKGFSISQGSLWIGKASGSRLRVFMLTNCVWHLEHDIDMCKEMHWCSSSLKEKVLCGDAKDIEFSTMYPNDSMVACVNVEGAYLECNFRDRTMKLLPRQVAGERSDSFQFRCWMQEPTFSLWPTPLPALSTTQSSLAANLTAPQST